jgi:hypothetical protein
VIRGFVFRWHGPAGRASEGVIKPFTYVSSPPFLLPLLMYLTRPHCEPRKTKEKARISSASGTEACELFGSKIQPSALPTARHSRAPSAREPFNKKLSKTYTFRTPIFCFCFFLLKNSPHVCVHAATLSLPLPAAAPSPSSPPSPCDTRGAERYTTRFKLPYRASCKAKLLPSSTSSPPPSTLFSFFLFFFPLFA